MIQHVPNSENTVQDLLVKSRNNDHFLAKDPATLWRKSRLAKEIPFLLDQDSQEISALPVADEPEWDPLEISSTPDVIIGGTVPPTTRPNELIAHQPTPAVDQILPNVHDLAYPVDTLNMLDNYFKYTHCWLPIMEHHDMLKTMHTSAGSRKHHQRGSSLALWAIMAYEKFTNGKKDTVDSDYLHIQAAILSQVMEPCSILELGHIQALLILVLVQIMQGDISHAWRLAGLASRMLASLPTAAKTNRYCHTFHGCILLDNMTSSLLGRTPCLSMIEQKEEGNLSEDGMEEWSVWVNPSNHSDGRNQSSPQGPLRALSIFNKINSLMRRLARISYSSVDMSHAEVSDIYSNLQAEQNLLAVEHPYDHGIGLVTPPVIILHLTLNFVVLALARKCPVLISTTRNDMTIQSLQSTVHLIDLFLETSGPTQKHPLLHCFALQAQQSLEIGFPNSHSDQRKLVETRLSSYLQPTETGVGRFSETSNLPHPSNQEVLTETPIIRNMDTRLDAFPNVHVRPPVLQTLDPQPELLTPARTNNRVSESPRLFASHSPRENAFGETGIFDSLFEEMVTSIPSNRWADSLPMIQSILNKARQQPSFAQNLGFYAGDLDKDFLEQLQHPANT